MRWETTAYSNQDKKRYIEIEKEWSWKSSLFAFVIIRERIKEKNMC